MKLYSHAAITAVLSAAVLVATPNVLQAQEQHADDHQAMHDAKLPKHAVAVLASTSDSDVKGVLMLDQMEGFVRVHGKVIGLTPGEHGFHIHEFGDLTKADGTSAGGHYAPAGHDHGAPGKQSHAGDLGNITANDDGVATVDIKAEDLKLHLVLGRSIVVHGGKDDLKSQPSGAAGPRVGVGVIGVANTEAK
ncbi:superoxide dismutase family protein [Stieleria sp. TO1_6]|uniref:superoxide dismutase family protein n=1 Tax=Stieleria tagensis TaxID=2956795 RepID=UPI00209AC493|nr:superoxide dismutase family protein [Stieleria tagensis]MCO8120259.1 superoxide dismutase family protein [Stieleria tagensis]